MTTIHAAYRPQHGLTEAVVDVFDRARYAILGTENPDGWMAWDTSAYNATLVEHGIPFDHTDQWYR